MWPLRFVYICNKTFFENNNINIFIELYILLQADLQTSTQVISLSSGNSEVKELAPDNTVDEVIHHEVKEIGTHM